MTPAMAGCTGSSPSTAARAEKLYLELLNAGYRRVDQIFIFLFLFEWLRGVGFALWISPLAWAGEQVSDYVHVWAAIFLGGAVVSLPIILSLTCPDGWCTRHAVAIGQILMGALLFQLSRGRIEANFHIFGSLVFLALYLDWRVLMTASFVVALDHFLLGIYWPRSVYGIMTGSTWRWAAHTAWVAFEDIVLVRGCLQSLLGLRELAIRQAEVESAHEVVGRLVEERTADLERANSTL